MNHDNRFFIISAELAHLGKDANIKRTATLQLDLAKAGLAFKKAAGSYGGTPERSFMVIEYSEPLQSKVMALAEDYNQESVLRRDVSGASSLIFQDGTEQYIGEWTPVTSGEALKSDGYTFCDGQFFTTKRFKGAKNGV